MDSASPASFPRPHEVDALTTQALGLRHEDTRRALELALQARELALRIDYQHGFAQSTYLISLCGFILATEEDVLEKARQAHSLFSGLGDARGEANALNLIGNIFSRRNRNVEALESYTRSLAIRREIGDRIGESGSLNNIALVHLDNAEYPESLEALFASLEIAEAIPDANAAAYALNNIGSVLAEIGDLPHALENYERGLALNLQTNDRALESTFHLDIGRTLAQLGDHSGALDHIRRGLALSQQTGNRNDIGLAQLALGRTYTELRRFEEAEVALQQALDILRQTGDHANEAETLLALGESHMAQSQPDAAITRLNQALALAEEHHMVLQRGKTHRQLSLACEQLGDSAAALLHFRQFYESEQRALGVDTQRRIRGLLTRSEVAQAQRTADAERRKRNELAFALDAAHQAEQHNRELVEQLISQAEMLKQLAREDGLTGIANRRWLDIQFAREVERAVRFGHPLSVAMIDMDDFKSVNDRCSHLVGDDALRAVARLLRDHTRSVDVVGRYGGDEFLVLLVETPLEKARNVCQSIQQAMAAHPWQELHPALTEITLSIGLCGLNGEASGPQELLARADSLLYGAKEKGKNRLCVEG
ncbi:MAG: diguanylate cyclase [Anaerolineae bacterium]|nr:MAG: diguanylate cyclase [Anaerolineae bacterium]